jgi:anti-sigma regulatory factor (Ser/Thr protein kinase)
MGTPREDLERVIRVKAETASLAEIRRFVEDVAAEAALHVERVFDLKVAVSEASANAVEHACCNTAFLEIRAQLRARRLTFIVTNTGRFRPPSPQREISSNRGLGMPLMVALMDEVSFARAPGGCTTVSLSVLLEQNATVPA